MVCKMNYALVYIYALVHSEKIVYWHGHGCNRCSFAKQHEWVESGIWDTFWDELF